MLHRAGPGLLGPTCPRLLRLRIGYLRRQALLVPQLDVCGFLNQVVWLTAVFVSLVSIFYSTAFSPYTKTNWSRIAFVRLLSQVPKVVVDSASLARELSPVSGLFAYVGSSDPAVLHPLYKKGVRCARLAPRFTLWCWWPARATVSV